MTLKIRGNLQKEHVKELFDSSAHYKGKTSMKPLLTHFLPLFL